MRRSHLILLILAACYYTTKAQEPPKAVDTKRSTEIELNNYFFRDAYIFMPVVKSNLNGIHVEGRYNYEDMETVSFWLGYHFTGGKKIEFDICPMFAGVFGNTSGFSPGMEISLTWRNFEFYTESEHVFDPAEPTNNFFYNWTDITYSVTDRFWLGITAQRTRLFKSDLELQRGLLIGWTHRYFEAGLAMYNLLQEEAYLLLMLNFSL